MVHRVRDVRCSRPAVPHPSKPSLRGPSAQALAGNSKSYPYSTSLVCCSYAEDDKSCLSRLQWKHPSSLLWLFLHWKLLQLPIGCQLPAVVREPPTLQSGAGGRGGPGAREGARGGAGRGRLLFSGQTCDLQCPRAGGRGDMEVPTVLHLAPVPKSTSQYSNREIYIASEVICVFVAMYILTGLQPLARLTPALIGPHRPVPVPLGLDWWLCYPIGQ